LLRLVEKEANAGNQATKQLPRWNAGCYLILQSWSESILL
jgi:hypothetical protein